MECDKFCGDVLRARFEDGLLPEGPIHEDVKSYIPQGHVYELAEALLAGFPCQASWHIVAN